MATNLFVNPILAVDSTGWFPAGSSTNRTAITVTGRPGISWGMRITDTAAAASSVTRQAVSGMVTGKRYWMQFLLHWPAALAGKEFQITFQECLADGTSIVTMTGGFISFNPVEGWQTVTHSATVINNTKTALRSLNRLTTRTIGDIWTMTDFGFFESDPSVNPAFDTGETPRERRNHKILGLIVGGVI